MLPVWRTCSSWFIDNMALLMSPGATYIVYITFANKANIIYFSYQLFVGLIKVFEMNVLSNIVDTTLEIQ